MDFAEEHGCRVRPSINSHKTWGVSNLQLLAGARGLSCGTATEASLFMHAGARDVLVAHPIGSAEQVQQLLLQGDDHSMVDPSFRDTRVQFVAESADHLDIYAASCVRV